MAIGNRVLAIGNEQQKGPQAMNQASRRMMTNEIFKKLNKEMEDEGNIKSCLDCDDEEFAKELHAFLGRCRKKRLS